MKKVSLRLLVMIAMLLLVLSFNSYGGGNKNKENIKIPSTTKILDKTTLQYLSSISKDGSVLIFNQTTPILESLTIGDVIVGGVSNATPYGLAPRKVTVVTKKGEQIVVETNPAKLEDAIERGVIRMKKDLTQDSGLTNK